jgi:hypothetical protein
MIEDLPDAVLQGLEAARAAALRRSSRLCIHDRGNVHRILRMSEDGFTLAATDAPPLRGYVDLYDGPRHLSSCLIVASEEGEGGERIYEFKMQRLVTDGPPADFERTDEKPVALITRNF